MDIMEGDIGCVESLGSEDRTGSSTDIAWTRCRRLPPCRFSTSNGRKNREREACFVEYRGRRSMAFFMPQLLSEMEVLQVLNIAQGDRACYTTGPDSVDGRPAYEIYALDKGEVLHAELFDCLQPLIHERLEPWARARYGQANVVVCTILLRRYLLEERRVHPPHFDAHAYATVVVGLNTDDFEGGLYVQPSPRSPRRPIVLGRGDAVMHQYDLRHGVEVHAGERYSLVFWLKDSMESCVAGTTPWYELAAAQGDGDAAYNLANLLMHEGRKREARQWYEVAAAVGQPDASLNLGVMLRKGLGCDSDIPRAQRCWMAAAQQGKPAAARHLGILLLEGSVEEKPGEGHRWLMKAARDGDSDAMLLLHQLPSRQGWTISDASRRRLLKRAAASGHPEAQFMVGSEYLSKYFELAASPSTSGSAASFVAWRNCMAWLRRAAGGGSSGAMLHLSTALCHPGAPCSDTGAGISWDWLRKAISAGVFSSDMSEQASCLFRLHYLQGLEISCLPLRRFLNLKQLGEEEDVKIACHGNHGGLTDWQLQCSANQLKQVPTVLKVWTAASG